MEGENARQRSGEVDLTVDSQVLREAARGNFCARSDDDAAWSWCGNGMASLSGANLDLCLEARVSPGAWWTVHNLAGPAWATLSEGVLWLGWPIGSSICADSRPVATPNAGAEKGIFVRLYP